MPAWDNVDRSPLHLLATFVVADLAIDVVMDPIRTDGYWLPLLVIVADAGFSGATGAIRLMGGNDGTNVANSPIESKGISAAGTFAIELGEERHVPRFLVADWSDGNTAGDGGIFQLYMRRLP
jgi:hypothetical protein